jgi:HSP20 family protein
MNAQNPTIRVSIGSNARRASARANGENESTSCQPTYTPPIDIHEGQDGLTLEADLPGATERNLSVQLEDNVLSLHVTIDSPAPTDARVLHEEYHLGDYQRSFILSDEVDHDRITAELKNGVLRLFLPKADPVRTRRIEINT